ncbi:MAG: extracellular solute-binding protein [gamma proteobacterium symbiont of Taylorina sp.]|nr:extracellular solute-binding protein [gamma proteobacterium symbiont of Taylorina sp.]
MFNYKYRMIGNKTKISCVIVALLFYSIFSQASQTPSIPPQITVGTQNVSAIGEPAKKHAKTFEEQQGLKVNVVQTDFSALFDEFMASLTAEEAKYDVLLFPSAWIGDFYPYLEALPEKLKDDEVFDDILPIYRERLMTWDNQWVSVTIDGDLFNGYYRKDLFEDPVNQADFKVQYGYRLYPPDSWQEYRDIAEFFTGRNVEDGTKLYGAAESFARGGQQFWDLFSRASAYTNHPDFPGAQFFDPDTMRAQVNNPGWLAAVKDYYDIVKFCPPDALYYGIVEARESFISGKTALLLDWGDSAQLSANANHSKISGKVGYFALPGSKKVWNSKSWEWQQFDLIHKVPFLAFGGWVAGVAKNSQNKEKAWEYIMWYSNPVNSLQDVVTAGTGINPYRFTHFSNIDAWTQSLTPTSAAEFLNVLATSLDSPNAALDLRIPGFYLYTEVLEQQLSLILASKVSVKKGMDKVAARWEQITDKLGRNKQLAIYRSSMGLNGKPAGARIGNFSEKNTYTLGFSQATTTEPWRLLFNKELRKEAFLHSQVKLLVRDGLDSIEKQQADIEEFIQNKVDAILISPKVSDALTPIVSKAFNQGIPVFVLDRDLDNDRYTQFIGGDNLEIGRAAGRYMLNLLGGKGKAKGNIIEIWGGRASTPAQDRHNGFAEIIHQEPGIKILTPPTDGDWKQDLAYDIMLEQLEKNPQIDIVYAHNDPMAYGAYLAAKEINREQDIAFIGIDAIPEEGVKWVSEGILTATFLYKTPGDEGIRQALNFLQGIPVKKRVKLSTMMIDNKNANQVLQQHGLK